jgi:PPOX class probable F420-dependent enzyme
VKPTPEQEKLISDRNLAILATVRKDGTPQLTPINYAYENGEILISITKTRAKYKNLRRSPKLSFCVIDPSGRPYVTVYGRARIEEEDIVERTAAIYRRITGDQPLPENFADALREQQRVVIILTPERFVP